MSVSIPFTCDLTVALENARSFQAYVEIYESGEAIAYLVNFENTLCSYGKDTEEAIKNLIDIMKHIHSFYLTQSSENLTRDARKQAVILQKLLGEL